MNDLDDLLGSMHANSLSRLDERLVRIERELMTRRLTSAETTTNLFDDIRSLTDQIMLLLPEHVQSIDVHRTARQSLERDRRLLERELRDEVRSRWRDVQELKKEQRQVLDDCRALLDRYEQFTTSYD